MDQDDEGADRPVWRAWRGWAACLVAAVTPTAMSTAFIQLFDGKAAPWFAPGVFVGLFTIMVLALRPWTLR